MTVDAGAEQVQYVREQALLRGRVAIVFQLSHHYLFLPFTALCMVAALSQPTAVLSYVSTPLVLQIFTALCASRLKTAYDEREMDDDPEVWARAVTIMSGVSGAIWGIGALIAATQREDWPQAGRLAQDFAGAAGGLGLTAIASSARTLAQGARDGANDRILAAAAGDVLSEHRHVTEALRRLYPDLAA